MLLFSLAFLLGDLYLQSFSQLPDKNLIITLVVGTLLCWIGLKKYNCHSYLLVAFVLGFSWSAWYAHSLLSWTLPKNLELKTVTIVGRIASIPINNEGVTQFLFALEQLETSHQLIRGKSILSISWQDAPSLRVGDKWHLKARLKRIHGLQNIGTFDYEAWALQKGLRAKGYVVANSKHFLIDHHWYEYPIQQLRQNLYEKIQHHLPNSPTSHWLITLIVGEHVRISKDDWDVLRKTGTNHLMAIAGLHIGLIAGFVHYFCMLGWRYIPYLSLMVPAQQASACIALIAAIIYSAMAGFSLPTERACLMFIIFVIGIMLKHNINIWHALACALFVVLSINPLSVLTESFWLSFGTIALIIYGMGGRLSPRGWWWKWFRIQWVIGLGLLPLTFALFQQASFISFIANSIAIPWLGFLILPFCFLSALIIFIWPAFASWLLLMADKSLEFLWMLLTAISQLKFSAWQLSLTHTTLFFLMCVSILILLLPSGFPGRWFGLIGLIPIFFQQHNKPESGDIWMTLLDVGQGLAVVVQTQHHILVYDTGLHYKDINMGERVLLPFLQHFHINKIDMLVVSHEDNDHIGGAQALFRRFQIDSIKTSVPEKLLANIHDSFESHQKPDSILSDWLCLTGNKWQWDKVNFSFLHPHGNELNMRNDSSCVLRIETSTYSILLTGDIEKRAEKSLLANQMLAGTTILVAPHHGSKTSILKDFIDKIKPKIVLYSTGYLNRYHFPHQQTVKIYKKINAQQFNTAYTGMMQINLINRKVLRVEQYRLEHKRYWMDTNF